MSLRLMVPGGIAFNAAPHENALAATGIPASHHTGNILLLLLHRPWFAACHAVLAQDDKLIAALSGSTQPTLEGRLHHIGDCRRGFLSSASAIPSIVNQPATEA